MYLQLHRLNPRKLPHSPSGQFNRFSSQLVLHPSHQLGLLSKRCHSHHHRFSHHTELKRSSVINAAHVLALESVSVVSAAHSCHSCLSPLIFHQQLVGGNDLLHLPLIATTIRMVAFRQCAIATFNLLSGGIGWKTQYC
jgi:hypothetical protein